MNKKKKRAKKHIYALNFFVIILTIIHYKSIFYSRDYSKNKLAREVSVEYVLLLDKLNKLELKYSKNNSEKIQEKITEINTELEKKYPEQISPN